MTTSGKRKRGFALLTQERRREIAQQGGLASQASGHAHRFTEEEARLAGQKGGRHHNREHMAKLGHRGGSERGRRLREKGGSP